MCKSNQSHNFVWIVFCEWAYCDSMGFTTSQLNVELALRFRRWLNAQSYAVSTQTAYHNRALKLCAFIGNKPLRKVTSMDIAEFIASSQPLGSGDLFVNSCLCALRCFFDFLHFGGIVDKVAPRFLKMRPRARKLPEFLTLKKARKLIYAAANHRDRALVELYYATGCRNSELRFVRIEKIDFRRRRFKVSAKRKERMVYYGAPAAKAIRRYIGKRNSGYLFQDIIPPQQGVLTHNANSWMGTWRDFRPGPDYGKRRSKYLGSRKSMSRRSARLKFARFLKGVDLTRAKPDRPLTKSTMGKIVSDVARRAGLGPMGPKILRHSFGTHMVEGGINLVALQELMGHSYLSSTQVYSHLSNKTVVSNFKKAHPRFK